MADPLLIAPDNRLFGWALNDLTLYGAQPVSGITVARAPADGASLPPPAETPAGRSTIPEAEVAARETTALLDQVGNQPDALASTPPAAPALIPAVPPAITVEAPPPSFGGGSFVPAFTSTPLQAAQAEGGAMAPIPPVAEPGPVALATEAPAPTPPLATDLASPGLATLAAQQVETVDPAAAKLADTLDTTVATATALPATVLAATDQASAAIESLVIESFGGSDPVAGLTTLVGLVESSEAFDIVEATVPVPDLPQPSILDALAADAAPSPLLGDAPGGLDDALDDTRIDLGL